VYTQCGHFLYLIFQICSTNYSRAHYIQQNSNTLTFCDTCFKVLWTFCAGSLRKAVHYGVTAGNLLYISQKWLSMEGKSNCNGVCYCYRRHVTTQITGDVIHEVTSTSRVPHIQFQYWTLLSCFLCHCLRVWMEEPITQAYLPRPPGVVASLIISLSSITQGTSSFCPGEEWKRRSLNFVFMGSLREVHEVKASYGEASRCPSIILLSQSNKRI
jgi:hypothetical protein